MPCKCNRIVNVLQPFETNPGQCLECWARVNSIIKRTKDRHVVAPGKAIPPVVKTTPKTKRAPRRLDCVYLGPITKNPEKGCGSCAKYHCEYGHGDVTRAFCFKCSDRRVPESEVQETIEGIVPYEGQWTRHLLYHIYPLAGNGQWQRNVDRLLRSIDVFNGKRYAAIVVDQKTDKAKDVGRRLEDHFDHILYTGNKPRLREALTFPVLMKKAMEFTAPGNMTACMHAKGVTHVNEPHIDAWVDMSYDTMLNDMPFVESLLKTHALAGPFKSHGGFNNKYRWYYSGTFFWVRNDEVAKRNWQHVQYSWFGSESWPGAHFTYEEGACLFGEGGFEYEKSLAEFEKWKSVHSNSHSATGS